MQAMPSREPLRHLMNAGFTVPEMKAFRAVERVERIEAMKRQFSLRLGDYEAGKCLDHYDHVSAMPFRTLTEEHFIASTRGFAAVRNWA